MRGFRRIIPHIVCHDGYMLMTFMHSFFFYFGLFPIVLCFL
jgi:hypothetical protein